MERYYYDQRRLEARRGGGGYGLFHYFFPFLIFIVIGLMGVLGFRLYAYFYGDFQEETLVYVVEGEAQMKLWGNEDFTKAYSGTKILQGDEVYTIRDSKVVVEFFNGTRVRMSGDTHLVFDEIYRDGSEVDIRLVLKKGEVWVNRTDARSSGSNFDVIGEYLVVNVPGGVVNFVHEENEELSVVLGAVEVDVYSENKVTVVDSFGVETGEAVVVDAEKLSRFWKFQVPNVVELISDEFKERNWYLWNLAEDEVPTDFSEVIEVVPVEELPEEVVVEDEVLEDGEVVPGDENGPVVEEPVEEEEVLELGPLTKPVILKVGGEVWDEGKFEEGIVVSEEPLMVLGQVSGAYEMIVNNYTLKAFEPGEGDESFVYRMSGDYGNLREGENIYEVYALDQGGVRSSSVFFKVIFEPVEEEEIEVLDETATEE